MLIEGVDNAKFFLNIFAAHSNGFVMYSSYWVRIEIELINHLVICQQERNQAYLYLLNIWWRYVSLCQSSKVMEATAIIGCGCRFRITNLIYNDHDMEVWHIHLISVSQKTKSWYQSKSKPVTPWTFFPVLLNLLFTDTCIVHCSCLWILLHTDGFINTQPLSNLLVGLLDFTWFPHSLKFPDFFSNVIDIDTLIVTANIIIIILLIKC